MPIVFSATVMSGDWTPACTRHAQTTVGSYAGPPTGWRVLAARGMAGWLLLLLLQGAVTHAAADDLVAAARAQIGVTTIYDGRYARLDYPGGDVPIERGVCTDVIIRAFRATGLDLQVAVHEDMLRAFSAYPRLWGLSAPDRNIDHRRVPNLETWLTRHAERIAVSSDSANFRAGDIVSWRLPNGLPHIGLVSDRRSDAGVPLVIHNIGAGTQEEDVLFAWPVSGHWRLVPRTEPTYPR